MVDFNLDGPLDRKIDHSRTGPYIQQPWSLSDARTRVSSAHSTVVAKEGRLVHLL